MHILAQKHLNSYIFNVFKNYLHRLMWKLGGGNDGGEDRKYQRNIPFSYHLQPLKKEH